MGLGPRKLDHLRLAIDSDVEHPGTTWLEMVGLVHVAAPELDPAEVSTSTRFLGRELTAPVMVAGMTGGHPATADVNCAIARAVEELGLAMGVGSQRAAIERPEPRVVESFRAARRCAPTAPIVANVGMAQLAGGYGVRELVRAVEMIDADAVAVHLNVGQEVVQPEGDRSFRGVVDAIARLADEIDVPLIVKETGHGLSKEVVMELHARGVDYFDVAGAGGTSWVIVEGLRARAAGYELAAAIAEDYAAWGHPTALSIVESRWAAPSACIIASGGIRSSLDALKALALGADVVAVALPVVRAYAAGGLGAVRAYLERLVKGITFGMVMVGARTLDELRRRPLILSGALADAMGQRGIDVKLYMSARSAVPHRC